MDERINIVEPLVTVGICTYNRPDGLRDTINCILNQSYKNLEIIISDDCSTMSNVKEVIDVALNNDNRITHYAHCPNIGMTENFAFPLKIAKGDYFMWAADDDLWDEEFISSCMIAHLSNTSISIVLTACNYIDKNNKVSGHFDVDLDTIGLTSKESTSKVISNIYGKPNLAFYGIFNRKLIKQTCLQLIPANDIAYVIKCSINGQIKQLHTPPYFSYRLTGSTGTFKKDSYLKLLKVNKINNSLYRNFFWYSHFFAVLFILIKAFPLKFLFLIKIGKQLHNKLRKETGIREELKFKSIYKTIFNR